MESVGGSFNAIDGNAIDGNAIDGNTIDGNAIDIEELSDLLEKRRKKKNDMLIPYDDIRDYEINIEGIDIIDIDSVIQMKHIRNVDRLKDKNIIPLITKDLKKPNNKPYRKTMGKQIITSYHDEEYIVDWIDSYHNLGKTKVLTIDDPRYSITSEHFKGTLYPPQETLLHAMIQLETKQSLKILHNDINYTAHSRCAILSPKFSFGKTILTLALICEQKYVLNKHISYPLLSVYSFSDNDMCNKMNVTIDHPDALTRYQSFAPNSKYGFFPEVRAIETDIQLLPITIVSAANSIIVQWEHNIKTFTNLTYFIINDVHSLKLFEKMIINYKLLVSSEILTYDIILIKIGSITKKYKTYEEIKAKGEIKDKAGSTRSIFDALRAILSKYKISRFIIDDFDVIKLTGSDYLINACFTWFISATRRHSNIKCPLYDYLDEPIKILIDNNLKKIK